MILLLALGCANKTLVTEDGRSRHYRVHVPTGENLPVVLALHGGGGSAAQLQEQTLYDAVADREGFVVVYPDGVGERVLGKDLNTWNGGYCCGVAQEQGVDDVAFLRQLVARLDTLYSIDTSRVFATGHSNGGILAHRLAVEAPDLVAGIAPVGAPGPDAAWGEAQPVPVRIVHGTADHCASYEGGETCGGCWGRAMEAAFDVEPDGTDTFPCMSVPDQLAWWQAVNGCDTAVSEVVLTQGAATCTRWASCTSGKPVELCAIEGGGHAWPGGTESCAGDSEFCVAVRAEVGPWNTDVDGAELGWAFFAGL